MLNNCKALLRMYKQLKYVLTEKQKRGAIWVFASMLLCSALELLGVSAIYPFLQMLLEKDALREKWYLRWIYAIKPQITDETVLIVLVVMIILVYVVKNVLMLLSNWLQYSYTARFHRECSTLMLSSYLRRPYQFFVNTNSGQILRGITIDTNSVHQILLNFFQICSEILTVILLGVYLLMTDWIIAVCAMVLAMFCFLGIVIGFKGKMKWAGKKVREASALQNQLSYQAINGIKEISVLDRRELFVEQYDKASRDVEKTSVINSFISACPDRILEGICIGGFMGIVCIRVLIGTDLNTFIPVLGTFAMGAFKILPSISKISSRINSIIYYQLGLEYTYQNMKEARRLDEEEKERESLVKDQIRSRGSGESLNDISFQKILSIRNICWHYENVKDNVLENLSLEIRKGEAVAFIGASGAGKTTLADIIMGLLKPQSGTVEMDGIDIFSVPHQWARIIGYVPQAVFLIDDTVRANVAFGIEREKVSDERVWHALEQAQLRKFVEGLPQGLDTIVGERGVKFSGGQRQRIAIARALYENPAILVLDEATSALDTETETAVMDSIEALQGTKTLIIVAHRLTTVRKCDKIYEIGNGVATLRDKEEVLSGI